MLFISGDDTSNKRGLFSEVLINGKEPEQDDNEKPIDYTAGDEDTGDTPNDAAPPNPNPASPQNVANPNDDPDTYMVPDEAEGNNPPSGTAATNNTPNTGEGTGGIAPTDYTADTTGAEPAAAEPQGADNTPDAGADPAQPAADAAEGMEGEGEPTDYTASGDEDGGEGMEGGEGGGDEGGGDYGGDESGDYDGDDNYGSDDSSGSEGGELDSQIKDLESDIYDNLTEPQMDIRNNGLKSNFVRLYDMIKEIIERVNDIGKNASIIKPLEFVSVKLADLSDMVSDYLVYTFPTKSYTENEVNYNVFLTALSQINEILDKIKPTKS